MRPALITLAIFASMCAVGMLTATLYPSNWEPVLATIVSTEIQSTRPGTPQWSLMADIRYEASGQQYEYKKLEVFRDPVFEVTAAAKQEWPTGRRFHVYFNAANPGSVSITKDGGREAAVVVSVVLVPVIWAFGFFVLALARALRE